MILEQLIFTILAFILFVYIFFKMIKENDTNYIGILVANALGIALNFIEVLRKTEFGIFLTTIKYLLGIIIPIAVFILNKKGIPLIQITNVAKTKIYLKFGNNKKAKEQLINLVTKYPSNYIGHKMLAEIYELEGGMRKAIDEYVQAIDINKKDYDSYYKIAELLNNLKKPDEAQEMLFNLLNKKPDYYKATTLLGDILISKEMYKEAVTIYQDALKYDPLDFELNYNLGIAYTMLNDFQNARNYYQRAAEINSLSYNSKYSLAEIALIYKELDEAEKYFIESLEDEDLAADSYFELSKISMIRDEKERAIQYANMAIELDSDRIAKKIKKDPIFIPVIAKISIPFSIKDDEPKEETNKPKTKLSKKELLAKKHLEDTFEITKNLSYTDIKLLKKDKENDLTEKDNNKEHQQENNTKQRDF